MNGLRKNKTHNSFALFTIAENEFPKANMRSCMRFSVGEKCNISDKSTAINISVFHLERLIEMYWSNQPYEITGRILFQ